MRRTGRGRRIATVAVLGGVLGVLVFVVFSSAHPSGRVLPPYAPDLENGETLYHAGSCIACHGGEPGTGNADLPAGGAAFPTPVGTFWPGNLTPDPETGIGGWTDGQFVDAMTDGVSPDGRHYFPAFPYTSYRDMRVEDLLDLRAYLASLSPVRSPGREPDIPMLALARRTVGLWKRLAFRAPPFRPDAGESDTWNRGAYLVHAPGHCGECHTPRDAFMVLDADRALEGGPHPRGEGEEVPSLRDLAGRGRYESVEDLTLALRWGETLGYEKLSSGGMAKIQMNLAKLPEDDLRAIAEYLMSLR